MSLIRDEQTKLTAGYLNAGASAFLAAGVVAPIAAGVSMFLFVSVGLHLAARYLLRSLRP